MPDRIIILTANFAGSFRTEMVDGKEWRVVPGVLMVEGVHTANNGPLYYPAPELEKSAPDWDAIPIVKNHPQKNGALVPVGSDPTIYEASGLGEVRATTWNGKLRTEYWFDMERCDKVDARIRANIDAGKLMEISTGLGHEIDKKESTFNGTAYTAIVRGIVPDHVALLLDGKGACDNAKGCGCGFTGNASELWPLTSNEASFSDIRSQLSRLLEKDSPYYSYIQDVFNEFFVYTGKNDDLWKLSYSMDGDKVVLGTETPVKVRLVTEYRTANGHFVGNTKEINVDKKTRIAALIASGTFTEEDRAWLEGQADDKIEKRHKAITANAAPVVPPAQPAPAPTPVPAPRQMSYNEWLSTLPPEKQEEEAETRRAAEQMKADLITQITANTKDSPAGSLSPDYLAKQPMSVLKVYAATTAPKAAAVLPPGPNYGGLAVVPPAVTHNNSPPPPAYVPPVLAFKQQ